jgi:hypothetical protein
LSGPKLAKSCSVYQEEEEVRKVAVHQAAEYRNRPRTLSELKTLMTAYIRNISQADLQKVFAS